MVESCAFFSHSSSDNVSALALRDWLAEQGWDDIYRDLDPQRTIAAPGSEAKIVAFSSEERGRLRAGWGRYPRWPCNAPANYRLTAGSIPVAFRRLAPCIRRPRTRWHPNSSQEHMSHAGLAFPA